MFNFPNLLTIGRILAIPLFVILLLQRYYDWALVVFIAAAVTDAIDGMLARLLHQHTALGSYLDPAADKLLSFAAFIMLAILNILPGWLAVIVISRDVIIVAGILIIFLTSHPMAVKPSLPGKLATTFQFTVVCLALFYTEVSPAPLVLKIFIWGTGILSVISGLQYIWRGIRIFNGDMMSEKSEKS